MKTMTSELRIQFGRSVQSAFVSKLIVKLQRFLLESHLVWTDGCVLGLRSRTKAFANQRAVLYLHPQDRRIIQVNH